MDKPRILLIEDELVVREFTATALSAMGMNVTMASTVAEARQVAGRHSFQLAICDVELPDGNGIELARDVADSGACPLVILSSGWPEEYEDHPCMKDGRFAFLPKPYGMGQLREKVIRMLQGLDGPIG